MNAREQLRLILRSADTEPVGLLVAGSTCLWGLWLLNPWANAFASTRLYQPLVQTGQWMQERGSPLDPELFWGVLVALLGGVHVYGVMSGHLGVRRWGAFSTFVLRLIPWVSVIVTGFWYLPVFIDATALVVAPLWIYWRLSGWPRHGQ